MLTSDLDYELPEDLIAQSPSEPRDASRLMVVDARARTINDHLFRELPLFLAPGDALVLNETKVLPARLLARRPGGGEVELLFLRDLGDGWEALARPSKRLRPGMSLRCGPTELTVEEALGEGRWRLRG
ncbi:MAG: S-adenosylmethionine:tRNA ribosyltransferase-isomerase, partial [Rubrobacter sp.]